MRKRKGLRVIPGGKSGEEGAPRGPQLPLGSDQLLQKADRYRKLLGDRADSEVSGLVGDMVDAITALRRLEASPAVEARQRALEYRRLIAELEIEIVTALQRP